MEVQAVIFDKRKFDSKSARTWLNKHKYHPIKKAHGTPHFIRYRIKPPNYKRYSTKKLGKSGVVLILGTKH